MAKKQSTQLSLDMSVRPGDLVLMGGTRASYPGHWYIGRVLWIGDGDVLIQRDNAHGDRWRQLESALAIRAFGTMEKLVAVRKAAREAIRDLQRQINDAESALGSARDTLWKRLEELVEKGMVDAIPPDFAAIDAQHEETRAAVERAEQESAS